MKVDRLCIVCDKEISGCLGFDEDGNDSFSNPPDDATVWTSVGNYGSTLFDMGEHTGERLECYVCDDCLQKKKNSVYHYQLNRKTEVTNLRKFKGNSNVHIL